MVTNCYIKEKIDKTEVALQDMKDYIERANETGQGHLEKGHFCYENCLELLDYIESQMKTMKQSFNRVK